MSDVLIKGMGMPKDNDYLLLIIQNGKVHKAISCGHLATDKLNVAEAVELPDSSWHTGTPTEEGWYLTKVTDVDKPYEVLKFENGKWSDYLDYDDVPEVVNDSFVLAYQKIEPFKEATE